MPESRRDAPDPVGRGARLAPARRGAPARRPVDRAFLAFALVTVGLAAAHVVILRMRRGDFGWAPVAAVLALAGLGLGAAAWRVARSRLAPVPRVLLAAALGYHALFGPVMLLYGLTQPVTSNDDLAPRLFPHVVHWLNSLE